MRVLILANGDPPGSVLAQRLAETHALIIAADGAAHRAAPLGIVPQIICGDFDSVRLDVARAEFPQAEIVPTPNQDRADLEKACGLALERGASAITILGAAGGRIDHTLANFALLLQMTDTVPIQIVDELAVVQAVAGTRSVSGLLEFDTIAGDIISVLSFDGRARVWIEGVQWPLQNNRLAPGTHGVSNKAIGTQVRIQVRDGKALVCHLAAQTLPAT